MNPDFNYINRSLGPVLRKNLDKGKVIVLYGARQVGKTTLLKKLFGDRDFLYLSCDQERIQNQLVADKLALQKAIGEAKNIILDEAQYLENPGLVLKILIDNFPDRNFVASGSSSFDLANKLNEPLTGRHFKFLLYPLSVAEIAASTPPVELDFQVGEALIYGSYPDIYKCTTSEEKIQRLTTLVDSYLYKDVLAFNLVKDSKKVRELLLAIAFQLGSEVSYSELAAMVGIDRKTVEYYLDLLEKSFVVFRLYGFSRNLRSEISRKVKIYFFDLGVRNAVINNFNALTLRDDGGGMFENFVVSEMVKTTGNDPQKVNYYFWRTYQGREVDLISEIGGKITAYEIKLVGGKKAKSFEAFKGLYPGAHAKIVTKDDLLDILVEKGLK